ncbi:hypothetical protein [Streptomyces sp. NPDC053431]|uniref:hypothetical protein n=1 Tax=Streptomyces sp. NPDC053431 TaxID=3365703 RepID=UPI0037D04B86
MKKQAKDLAKWWLFCAAAAAFWLPDLHGGQGLGDTLRVMAFGGYLAHTLDLTIGLAFRLADAAVHRPDEVVDAASHPRST